MKIDCVIIDDEYPAIGLLENYASRIPFLNLKNSFEKSSEALKFLNNNHIDLMFLDIDMPGMNGFNLLKNMKYRPYVVITSAYDQYALFAYEIAIDDYLLKPYSFDRFELAAERIKQRYEKDSINSSLSQKYITIKIGWETEKLLVDDILYVQGMSDYLSIYTSHKRIITLMTFQDLINILPPDKFLRVHKSFLVALDKIERFNSNKIKIGNVEIPIGRTYKHDFIYKLEEIA